MMAKATETVMLNLVLNLFQYWFSTSETLKQVQGDISFVSIKMVS